MFMFISVHSKVKYFILGYLIKPFIVISAKSYSDIPGCSHTCRHILYLTCTCYSCLPEDESSGSKHVHVENIVKIKLKVRRFNKGAFCWSV